MAWGPSVIWWWSGRARDPEGEIPERRRRYDGCQQAPSALIRGGADTDVPDPEEGGRVPLDYFYRYAPPGPLEEIEADIRTIEKDIMRMLAEVAGGGHPE